MSYLTIVIIIFPDIFLYRNTFFLLSKTVMHPQYASLSITVLPYKLF